MPAKSKAQQQAAGIALAAKRGDIPKSKLRGASASMAKMGSGELKKFAKTKSGGLPKHVMHESHKLKFSDICRAGAAVNCLKGGQSVKSIAKSAGKGEGAVRHWVKKAGFSKKGGQWRHASEARANRIVSTLLEDGPPPVKRVCAHCDKEQGIVRKPEDRCSHGVCRRHSRLAYGEYHDDSKPDDYFSPDSGGPTPPKASFAPNPGYAA